MCMPTVHSTVTTAADRLATSLRNLGAGGLSPPPNHHGYPYPAPSTTDTTPPMHHISLEEDHHSAHMDDDNSRFYDCVPVMIHCEDKNEARAVAEHVAAEFGTDTDPDDEADA